MSNARPQGKANAKKKPNHLRLVYAPSAPRRHHGNPPAQPAWKTDPQEVLIRRSAPEEIDRAKRAKVKPHTTNERAIMLQTMEGRIPGLLHLSILSAEPWDGIRSDAAGLSLLHGLMNAESRGMVIESFTADNARDVYGLYLNQTETARADKYRAAFFDGSPAVPTRLAVNVLSLVLDFWRSRTRWSAVLEEQVRRKQAEMKTMFRKGRKTIAMVELYNFFLGLMAPLAPA